MTPANDEAFDRLVGAAIDGELGPEDEARLTEVLRSSKPYRERYRRLMTLHAQLRWDHGAAAAIVAIDASAMSPPARLNMRGVGFWQATAAVLAATLLLACSTYFAFPRNDAAAAKIVTLESLDGAGTWSTRGLPRPLTGAGPEALPAGTLLLEGEGASCVLRFHDGTRLTVTGEAELSVAEDRQKRVWLRRGGLIAEVQPQPAGQPLLIETPSARVEVIGTVFSLAAEGDRTTLHVDAGVVRLRRMIDGREISVEPQQHVVVSLDASRELASAATAATPTSRRLDLQTRPAGDGKGIWVAPGNDEPGRLTSVPCLAGRKADGTPFAHYGVSLRSTGDAPFATVTEHTVIQLRYRMRNAAPIKIMLGVVRPNGRFGGNFEAKYSAGAGTTDDAGWTHLEIPITKFRNLIRRFPEIIGQEITLIGFNTLEHQVGLELSGAEIAVVKLRE